MKTSSILCSHRLGLEELFGECCGEKLSKFTFTKKILKKKSYIHESVLLFLPVVQSTMIFRRPNHQIAHLHAAYRVSAIKHVPSSWSSQRINIKNIHIFIYSPLVAGSDVHDDHKVAILPHVSPRCAVIALHSSRLILLFAGTTHQTQMFTLGRPSSLPYIPPPL